MSAAEGHRPETADALVVTGRGERFEVPVGPGGGVGVAAAALTRKLDGLAVPTHRSAVFVSVVGRPGRYTQCLIDIEHGAWVECVGNEFLAAHEQLTPDQEQVLLDLGYDAPGKWSPNFSVDLDQPVDWARVVRLLLTPFTTVFPCHDREAIEVVVERYFAPRGEGGADADGPRGGDDAAGQGGSAPNSDATGSSGVDR